MRGLLEACCDAPELLELAEAAFDEMALGIEMLVERMLSGARRVVGDHGKSALCRDGLTEVVGIVGSVGHDHLGGQTIDQWRGLRHVTAMTGGERETNWTAQTTNCEVDFCAQAAARPANGLIFRPPFLAPAAC